MKQESLKVRIKNALNLVNSHLIILDNNDLMWLCNNIEDERVKRLQKLQKKDIQKINKIVAKEQFYCGICELEHDINDTGCVRGSEDDVLLRYEDKHGE